MQIRNTDAYIFIGVIFRNTLISSIFSLKKFDGIDFRNSATNSRKSFSQKAPNKNNFAVFETC